MHLLIVEGDASLARRLGHYLAQQGYAVDFASTLQDAQSLLLLGGFDAVVLDRDLPDGDGLDLCRELRSAEVGLPILVLSGREDVDSVVESFECGADDHLVKPCKPIELRLRIAALLRRGSPARMPVVRCAGLEIDGTLRRVARSGVAVALTSKEFAIIETLADPPGRLVDRLELLERCWDHAETPGSNVIDVHIRSLRRKLGQGIIQTQRGVGYRLAPS